MNTPPLRMPQLKCMISLWMVAIGALLGGHVLAQPGLAFPPLSAEDLNGQEVMLPKSTTASHTLIGMATTKKAEEALRTWQNPVYQKFVVKSGMMDQMFDVDVYFVPVFTGAAKAAKGQVVKKLKENNEPLVADHLLIYSGEKERLDRLGMEDRKKPYFYLVDANGEVVWRGEGSFKSKYLDEIESILVR